MPYNQEKDICSSKNGEKVFLQFMVLVHREERRNRCVSLNESVS